MTVVANSTKEGRQVPVSDRRNKDASSETASIASDATPTTIATSTTTTTTTTTSSTTRPCRKSHRIELNSKPKYFTGTVIQKKFFAEWYEGTVLFFWVKGGQKLYRIRYDDNDKEDIEEKYLQEFIDNAIDDKKALSCKLRQAKAKAKRPRATTATASASIKVKSAKKARRHVSHQVSSGKKKGSPVINENSSLWPGVFGKDKGPQLKQSLSALVKANPPTQLPPPLWECVPLMLEFYLLLWERQHMFLGKRTTVSAMVKHHFCNNYRELDRGTGYLRAQLMERHDELLTQQEQPRLTRRLWLREVLGMAYIYRLCNKQTSYSSDRNPSGGIPRLGEWTKPNEQTGQTHTEYCRLVQSEHKEDPSNPTFMTRAHQALSYDDYIKYGRDSARAVPLVAQQIFKAGSDLKQVCNILKQLGGISKFRAWQVACDLEEAGCLGSVEDNYTLLGPGAENGLCDIFGKTALQEYGAMDLAVYLKQNMTYCLKLVGLEFPFWDGRPVTLKVIEHALCEFNKFQRMDAGIDSKLRTRSSQSHLDKRPCDACQRGGTHGTVRCDTCFFLACHECKGNAFVSIRLPKNDETGRSCCRQCDKIDRLTFAA